MVDASELRLSATEYTEAEYQLAKLVAKEVPVDQDARLIFFAEVERCEERVRAVAAAFDELDLDEGIAFTGTNCTTDRPDGVDQTATGPSSHVESTQGVLVRGPLLPTGHLRKLVRNQGKTTEWSLSKIHKKLDQLIDLIASHFEIKKKLPEAHDDVKQMLLEQVKCVEKLHAKLKYLAQLLDDKDTTGSSTGDKGVGDDIGQDTYNERLTTLLLMRIVTDQ
ncbi:hypothetical protein VSDG_07433 [Cytospora chrysosperma]|uniref:Uncharacterized protein n=1 Tax=Cytospora chrysosperma TaxID=252740 RepID=A0A423VI16_CYTCH|nr:hypothetical protein VSDG_07433 [Valsa sordida]